MENSIVTKAQFRAARLQLGLTQGGLASICGVSHRLIQMWENDQDRRYPSKQARKLVERMLAGFRPPQFKPRTVFGRKNRELEST